MGKNNIFFTSSLAHPLCILSCIKHCVCSKCLFIRRFLLPNLSHDALYLWLLNASCEVPEAKNKSRIMMQRRVETRFTLFCNGSVLRLCEKCVYLNQGIFIFLSFDPIKSRHGCRQHVTWYTIHENSIKF